MRKVRVAKKLRQRRLARLRRKRILRRRGLGRKLHALRTLRPRPRVNSAAFEQSAAGVPRVERYPSHFLNSSGRRRRCWSLRAPEDFRYHANPEGVLAFVYELRRQVFILDRFRDGPKRDPGLYIELDDIRWIDLEGALILTAEIDRIRLSLDIKPRLDDQRWDPDIRAILHGLGLHKLVNATRSAKRVPIDDWVGEVDALGLVVVPFESDTEADGQKAQALRDRVYSHCEPPSGTRYPLYDALIEAVLNAVQHAYPPGDVGDGLPPVGRWWAGALVDKRRGEMYLVVYDQGVGIPATLPRRDWWSLLQGQLPELNDAAVIEGALDYGRSGTDTAGRGNGLWRICALAESFPDADIRFTSLKGQVDYSKGGRMERATLATRFCGTMIRWRATVQAQEQSS